MTRLELLAYGVASAEVLSELPDLDPTLREDLLRTADYLGRMQNWSNSWLSPVCATWSVADQSAPERLAYYSECEAWAVNVAKSLRWLASWAAQLGAPASAEILEAGADELSTGAQASRDVAADLGQVLAPNLETTPGWVLGLGALGLALVLRG